MKQTDGEVLSNEGAGEDDQKDKQDGGKNISKNQVAPNSD